MGRIYWRSGFTEVSCQETFRFGALRWEKNLGKPSYVVHERVDEWSLVSAGRSKQPFLRQLCLPLLVNEQRRI